jgi:hypothetical protein
VPTERGALTDRSLTLAVSAAPVSCVVGPCCLHFEKGERGGPRDQSESDECFGAGQKFERANRHDVAETDSGVHRRGIVDMVVQHIAVHTRQSADVCFSQQM